MYDENITAYKNVLSACPLFAGMTDEEITESVRLLDGCVKSYPKGEMLHKPHTKFTRFGLVIEGSVNACCDDFFGNRIIMADVRPGTTFGEALCCLGTEEPDVYVRAAEKTKVLWLSSGVLYDGISGRLSEDIRERFVKLLAMRTLSMNGRIQVLSKLTIREKLLFYFSRLSESAGSDTFRVTMTREDMASYIGADRSALSRELSRMKRDGIIDYGRDFFRLIKPEH